MARLLVRAPALVLALAGAWLAALPAAAADAAHGKSVFAAQCSMCHTASKGGPTILGPPLFGVVGRKAGSFPGYAYSPAMRSAGFAWSEERLETYLTAPQKMLPGIKMTYTGLKNMPQLEDLVAYLQTQK